MRKSRLSLASFLLSVSAMTAYAADEIEPEDCTQSLVSFVAELEAYGNLNSSTKGRDVYRNMGDWTEYSQCKIKPGQDGTSASATYYVDRHPDNQTVFVTRIMNDTGISELFGPFKISDFE